ncbi:histidine phosphatase family protein [Candidatus Woesearchaeota archaeon]|nr:histidine phosphatase family protein [Candidatus Woesearchaeota archaeon]
MRLIITRHGETVDNVNRIIQGHKHGKLTEKGIEQAKKLGKRLTEEKIDYIYSSDLYRAKETTENIAENHPKSKIIFDKRIRERDYGKYNGMKKSEVNWREVDEKETPENVESLTDLRKRLEEFYEEILKKHHNQTVLVVSHSTASRILIGIIMKKSIKDSLTWKMANASVNIIEI